MKCPKCHSDMERVTIGKTDIDRCLACKGLWFDVLEDQELLKYAREIDTGDNRAGGKNDAADQIFCPVCANVPMVRMVDNRQPHIRFESCPRCYGRYFDAGEYRDLGEHTFVDIIKDLFAKERK